MIEKLFRLDGKVALVTGASSGIGKGMARALAAAGAAVVHVARSEDALLQAVAAVRETGGRADHVAYDVGRIDELDGLARKAEACFGPVDILINAAGVNPRRPWQEITEKIWNDTMALNLGAPFFLAKQVVPGMLASGWGKIVNIASLQSVRAFKNGLTYGASKGGVMQLTRAMAESWSADRSGITCNAIAPGFFKTGLTAPLYEDENVIRALARQTITGRTGVVEDIDGLTIFLASPASDYITGQTIFIDGGWTAK
ncbi:2-deoxy-D-gluconate 3-dehydrogenase [Desulfosarcina alkanivorans]|jgi:NAD(P)-dependent dehydrogenase (short-subunit alcohol dehydrogenase family)|uniref:2-deoxy-D-gluconate 3-dehydrogenase n=1 Tax=Desulfosarcina alkanivorans TaxID=571177 RepID=A0A5K7YWX6_9BACT|nr:SDR family oxidoreductase [Desulfosarcina alkanivorans]BBO72473.1 2-deoxy-D-gluconate 3-dehydrogenase [Desulfosarcina alkanivorans]